MLIFLLTITPIILWLPDGNFSTSIFLLRSLGQISGLLGMVLFSLEFVLSARLKFLERFFAGLNYIYIYHHQLGAVAFILLLAHPVFLVFYYLPISLLSAANLFIPTLTDLPLLMGIIALVIMIILLLITLFVKIPYDSWKNTHKYLGVSLFIAGLHVFFINSTVTFNIPLRIYMLVIVTIGLSAFIYKVLLGRFFVSRLSYLVDSVRALNSDVIEINMSPKDQKHLKYFPGQFIFTDFNSLGITTETHPFSLISLPSDTNISLAVKSSGDYTETLKLLRLKSLVRIEGPFGYFNYHFSKNKNQIWIAGGIGVTPFISQARSIIQTEGFRINLIYSVNTQSEAVLTEVLQKIADENPDFHFTLYASKERGSRLTADFISTLVPDLSGCDVFICGPVPMMSGLRRQFIAKGLKNSAIHSEEFSLR